MIGGSATFTNPLHLPEDIETAVSWYADQEVLYFSEGQSVPTFDRIRTADGIYIMNPPRGRIGGL